MLDQIKRYMRKRLGAQSSSTPISNEVRNLIERLKQKKLTYLSDRKLNSLATTCLDIEEKKLEGLFMEAGCALGRLVNPDGVDQDPQTPLADIRRVRNDSTSD
jgi:hypothetical protein